MSYELEYTVQEHLHGKLIKYYENKKIVSTFVIATGSGAESWKYKGCIPQTACEDTAVHR
jgi:hypothetical protein